MEEADKVGVRHSGSKEDQSRKGEVLVAPRNECGVVKLLLELMRRNMREKRVPMR